MNATSLPGPLGGEPTRRETLCPAAHFNSHNGDVERVIDDPGVGNTMEAIPVPDPGVGNTMEAIPVPVPHAVSNAYEAPAHLFQFSDGQFANSLLHEGLFGVYRIIANKYSPLV
jgi:hypothetical protein